MTTKIDSKQEVEKFNLDDRQVQIEKYQRDKNGLLKNIAYVFTEDGRIDWKAMIPKKYIVFNEEWFVRNNETMPVANNLSEVENPEAYQDKQLMILLGGMREIAKIRGLISTTDKVIATEDYRSVVNCEVRFIPNYEDSEGLVGTGTANASIYNTNEFMHLFLETIASNRAFVRAVRSALRIDVVGSDEMSNIKADFRGEVGGVETWRALEIAVSKTTIRHENKFIKLDSFGKFKSHLLRRRPSDISEEQIAKWNDYKDIPPAISFRFLGMLREKDS